MHFTTYNGGGRVGFVYISLGYALYTPVKSNKHYQKPRYFG